jgi:hypothetical protein
MEPNLSSRRLSSIRWVSNITFVLAVLVLIVSLVSLLGLFLSGFSFDPDDYPSEYYRAEAVVAKQEMLSALLLPTASLMLAALSGYTSCRAGARVVGSLWLGALSALMALAMIYAGTDNIESALYFADLFAAGR